ncbi:MAG: ferritin-like domain-containing protein [Candidatus Marinarcus sp.]|uniref:ferritin-like domain-containing protein n=1 Tax=Candidatus Marinarcus sp. TaxID=3100987 RepID=UPI003B00E07A
MNVYDYAMKVEKDGEAYYRELALKSPNNGLKRVFNILAEAEVKHYNVFKSMRDKDGQDINTLDISTDTKTIFETLSSEKNSTDFSLDEIKFYEDAIKREEDSFQFYADKAKELSDEDEKKIFLQIAQEEIKHKEVLENILSFIQEPTNWVASAEF